MQPYFRSLGFECPQRKDEADFIVEVTTDQGKLYVVPGGEEEVCERMCLQCIVYVCVLADAVGVISINS